MALTGNGVLDKIPVDEKKPLLDALQEILSSGFGEVLVKIQNGKIVFVQGVKNFK
jgi:hypothetical protein